MKLQRYLPLAALLTACGGAVDTSVDTTSSRETWSNSDNPSIFAPNLTYTFDTLPASGEAASIPWASNYWPTAHDNINFKWDGSASDSAAMKYQKAFGGTDVEGAVSRNHGIDSMAGGGTACTTDSQCKSADGEICAKRNGRTSGYCIPTWFGICHAWAPVSMLLPEPQRPVTVNGVTFKVNDIKALATLVHDRTSSKFVSLRCNGRGSELVFDKYGRPQGGDCKDTNPGTWHVLLANYLGKMKTPFVEDRTYDYEVWNQPIRGFRMTSKRDVTALEANRLIGVSPVGGTTSSKSGTLAAGAWATNTPYAVVAGSPYRVKMTGTGDADVYVRFGAAPTTSAYDCRPYSNGSAEECGGTVPAGATSLYVYVNGYAASTYSLSVEYGGSIPSTYQFNANARRLIHVKTDVDYITESDAHTDGNLAAVINQYTRTDKYEYVLELDSTGKITGGEWIGSSKQNHPDFVWLPIQVSGSSVAGGAILYSKVKALVDESVKPTGGGGGDKTDRQSGTLAKGDWKQFGPYTVSAGATLTATLTGTGDADLYVRKAAAPTLTAYDCRPYYDGSNENCAIDGAATVYVGVNGYATSSTFTLDVKYR